MRVKASPGALTSDVPRCRSSRGQSRSLGRLEAGEENVRLERKLAEGERLARWARWTRQSRTRLRIATAIKSIAQVMSEDEALKVNTRAPE